MTGVLSCNFCFTFKGMSNIVRSIEMHKKRLKVIVLMVNYLLFIFLFLFNKGPKIVNSSSSGGRTGYRVSGSNPCSYLSR